MKDGFTKFATITSLITPIAVVISIVWFVAEIDKRVAILESANDSIKTAFIKFEKTQETRNLRQDRMFERYQVMLDDKLNRLDDRINHLSGLLNGHWKKQG